MFSISNGKRTHVFSRTLGDLTDLTANAIAENKHISKANLRRAGIRTPAGVLVGKGETSNICAFLSKHPGKQFVVKPYNGSLSVGIFADVSPEDVLEIVTNHPDTHLIVEEHISGRECRATVVGGRCIAVSLKNRPTVLGDGLTTMRDLVLDLHTRLSKDRPLRNGLSDLDKLQSYLARSSLRLDTVVPKGTLVKLSNTAFGSIHEDITEIVSAEVKSQAVQAAATIGLANCGIDLFILENGEVCVLELNQRAQIGAHSFPHAGESPGQGNSVAEAIVDYYFPETVNEKVRSNLAYDSAPIRTALASGQISELSLPVIGSNWCVLRFVLTGAATEMFGNLIVSAARMSGVFHMCAPRDSGEIDFCLASAPENFGMFLDQVPKDFRSRLEELSSRP